MLITSLSTSYDQADPDMHDSKTSPKDFPLQGLTNDGWSNEDEATATCACGAVQMVIVRVVTTRC